MPARRVVDDGGAAPEAPSPGERRPLPAATEPAAPAPGEPVSDAGGQTARTALELAGLVIAATTLISALAFYFGWAITSSKFAYFGIDSSAVGFSTQDYILRSTDALFVPLGAIVVVALAALALHAVVTRALGDPARLPALPRIARAGSATGAVLFAIGLWGAVEPLPVALGDLFTAASPGIGIAVLAYGLHVRALVAAAAAPNGGRPRPARGLPRVAVTLVFVLVALSAFWTTAVFAQQLGHERGRALGRNLDERPGVTVLSPKALHLTDTGATEQTLTRPDSAYRYRYGALRLLFRAGGRYFLVADGWRPSSGAAIVLNDEPALRFEFRPGSR